MTDADTAHKLKMERRKQVQEQRLAERDRKKGLLIVHTGDGKGKSSAAFGMIFRSLGHGLPVAVIQFIKGAWEPGEAKLLGCFPQLVVFRAMGEGFTWETQDRKRDIAKAGEAWEAGLELVLAGRHHIVLLDEINVAMKLGYLDPDQVLAGLARKPEMVHVVLTGRGAPEGIIEAADLVTEMKLVKHPFRSQGIKAQLGIEY
ncbi:MAG: cob(I)yrinic acid a,c-diamide adenosyltransferase [Aphanocapsa lilacina HA4352-LM1]|jgi:cob(I)alamin adenosyltransferase|nr:cob(I)yrinic acid a,c-diamide adenosyltransferase [Aphanocapsa lilacina HA4352-LM1]